MKNHLEQEITEFVAQSVQVLAVDGVGNLIGLFDRVGRDGREILIDVPRTPIVRVAKPLHDFK